MNIIYDDLRPLPDQAMNCIRAMQDIELEITNDILSQSIEKVGEFTIICDLNQGLATNVKDFEAAEPV